MQAGTTFVLAEEHQDIDPHLWLVLSDTVTFPDQVVIVNVTTHKDYKDQACVIERNEHPTLTHRSCVMYSEARVVTLAALRDLRYSGKISLREEVSASLLERIRRCAGDSTEMKDKVADILIEQGIIDLEA